MSNAVMYGLYLAVGYILFTLITFFTDTWRATIGWGTPIMIVMMIIAVVMAIKDRRDNENGGTIRYPQAFSTGFTAIMVGTIVITIFSYIYSQFINLEFMDFIKEVQIQAQADKMTEAQRAQADALFGNPWLMAIGQIVMFFVIGSIITAIAGAVLKKNPEPQVMA